MSYPLEAIKKIQEILKTTYFYPTSFPIVFNPCFLIHICILFFVGHSGLLLSESLTVLLNGSLLKYAHGEMP